MPSGGNREVPDRDRQPAPLLRGDRIVAAAPEGLVSPTADPLTGVAGAKTDDGIAPVEV